MSGVTLLAPFAGWAMPLDEVPDAVFAERMMGDGVALDPFEGEVRSPCGGEVLAVAPTGHSVTIRAANGAELLIHVGLDTVGLGGDGFEALVRGGERVAAGVPLLRVDLDRVARGAPSLVTPLVVTGEGFAVRPLAAGRRVAAGEPLCEVVATGGSAVATDGTDRAACEVVVPLAHGLHARPAARIGAALKPLAADVRLVRGDRSANARSVVALLGLGVAHGDRITVAATGRDARAAVETLAALIEGGMGEAGPAARRPDPVPPPPPTPTPTPMGEPGVVRGVRAAPGLALGVACQLRAAEPDVPEHGGDPAAERAALARVLGELAAATRERAGAIAEAHAALLDDPEWLAAAHARIDAGAGAALAWREAGRAKEDAIRATGDPLLIERVADLRDVERRVVLRLTGEPEAPPPALPPDAILLADDLFPSQFMALDAARLAGICTAGGGPTSHVAVLAASAGVPMLVAAGPAVLDLPDGAPLVLDADAGTLAPADEERAADARARLAERRERARAEAAAAHEPCRTADGVRIEVFANCGSADDAAAAARAGAEGCGLLRTEFLFLGRETAPTEDEQAQAYAAVAAALGDRPMIVRTMDVGGDKPVPFLRLAPEDNPALGQRGVRVSLARPELLREQFRAILRGVPAAARVRIMLPMVVDAGELRVARALLTKAAASLGVPVPPLGVMVETPAAALLADTLAPHADFLSVGSNDLTQYALAADRGNPSLAARLDALHPAVLRLIARAAEGAAAHGRWLGVCGGVASEPAAAALLVGLGATELSAAPAAVPAVKAAVRRVDTGQARALAARALACATAAEVRALPGDAS